MNKTTVTTATSAAQPAAINVAHLQERAKALRLMGLLAHWDEPCRQTSDRQSVEKCLKFAPADHVRVLAEVHC